MPFRARLSFFAVALAASLLALPEAASAQEDLAVTLKSAVPRDLIPANFRNEAQPTLSGSGSLQYVTIRFNGPDRAAIEFELTSFSRLPVPIQKVYEMEANNLSDAEILERNLGIGEASFRFQRRAPFLAPFDIRGQTVRAYWKSFKLMVDVRDYHTVGGALHLGHDQAARLARDLAKATLDNILHPTGPRPETDQPEVRELKIIQRHVSREVAEIDITALIRYPGPFGKVTAGDVLVSFRIQDARLDVVPGQPGFVVEGSVLRVSGLLQTTATGRQALNAELTDRRLPNETNPMLPYQDRLRKELVIMPPAAEIKGVAGDVAVCRIIPSTRARGITVLRNSPRAPEAPNDEFEAPTMRWLYEGDRVQLSGKGASSIDLEWREGVRGKALFDGRLARYTNWGEFTIGPTRGSSGEITNRWKRTWGESFQVLWESANEQVRDEGRDQVVEWFVRKVPAVGGALATGVNALGVFSWHAGGTVLSDIVYLELNSEVYIKPGASGTLAVYTLEGNPVVHYNRGRSKLPLTAGQVATVAPGREPVTGGFNPGDLDRWWDRIRYDPPGKARPVEREGVEPVKPAKPVPPAPPAPPTKPVKAAAAGAIPELGAEVIDLKFYEEGVENIPQGQRTYRTFFDRSATRYVRWELRLKYPAPGRRVDFAIEAVWTGPDGSDIIRHTYNGFAGANWTSSYHDKAWGWDEPGRWSPGAYTIRLYHGGREIASGSFKVGG